MPRQPKAYKHLPKTTRAWGYCGMGARTVLKSERKPGSKGSEAMLKEFNNLVDKECFRFSTVMECGELRAQARAQKRKPVHIAMIFGICVEKNPHLPENDSRRRFKGRFVYQGNNVTDEFHQAAIFQELSSNPASMEAAKVVDAISCFPGNWGMQADAEQAYIQAPIDDTIAETWIRLPKEN